MKIQGKITSLVTALIGVIVGSIVINFIVVDRRKIIAESSARIDVLMEGVMRIARESLIVRDELMLLSYLKFLMQEYPEIELALISREGHSSVIGEIKSELFYRTITVTDRKAAAFKATEKIPEVRRLPVPSLISTSTGAKNLFSSDGRALEGDSAIRDQSIPPETFTIQLGFSKTALDRRIHEEQLALEIKMLRIAGIALFLGLAGSFWVSRLLATPLLALVAAAQGIARGELNTRVNEDGSDEIADLARQFNSMSHSIREANLFKEDLMHTLTHELNNPLAGLKGFLKSLQASNSTQSASERLMDYETMLEATAQMELSLGNALRLFRSGSSMSLQEERFCAAEVLDEVVRLFLPAAQGNGTLLKGPILGAKIWIIGDRELIRRIIINLISNALRFTGSGGSVTAGLDDGPDEIKISVVDTGLGIAPEYQEAIFTKFFRAPTPDGKPQRIPGSGLGLYITKQAVELHHGKIWLQSAVGKGSSFFVTLPKKRAAIEANA